MDGIAQVRISSVGSPQQEVSNESYGKELRRSIDDPRDLRNSHSLGDSDRKMEETYGE